MTDDLQQESDEITATLYFAYAELLVTLVKGKTVERTLAGKSGFALFFDDGSWVASYLDRGAPRFQRRTVLWEVGTDTIPGDTMSRINSTPADKADGRIPANGPYAGETCDFEKELARAVGSMVHGVMIGSDCYSFCFTEGRELETWIVPDRNGKAMLSVFWEQW